MQKNNTQVKQPQPRWRRWLKEGVIILVALTVISTAIDYWHSQDMPSGSPPELITSTTRNQPVDLLELSQEQPVLVYFWASWCTACKFVTPVVNRFTDSYKVVTIAIRSGNDQRINAYLDKEGYHFPVVNDQQGAISQAWGIKATPTLVILKDGQIHSVTTGITTPPSIWLRLLLAG